MNTTRFFRRFCVPCLVAAVLAVGCDEEARQQKAEQGEPPKVKPGPTKKVEVAKNVYLEIEGDRRRVLVKAEVCRRMDQLEQLLCRKRTKEHEAILAADADASKIHAALLLAGAEPGHPVKFTEKKIIPPSGTVIKVFLQYEEKGQAKTVRAQEWIRNIKTMKPLAHDWVFAGSMLLPDPFDKTRPPRYAANDGDVICLANFESAMLDLPIDSSQENAELVFEAFTERIPPLETPVWVILEPVPKAKKK
jgi:hypothetical protein